MTDTQIHKELRATLRGLNSTSEMILKKINHKEEKVIIFNGLDTFALSTIINYTSFSTMLLGDILSEDTDLEQITTIIGKHYPALSLIRGLSRKLRDNHGDDNSRIFHDITLYGSLQGA